MNIQIGKVTPPSDGSTAVRAGPSSGSNVATAAAPPPRAAIPAAQTTATAQALNIDAARQVASQINDFLKSSAAEMQFSVDSESDRVVVRIIDTATNQVIRQMPSEEMLAISRSLDKLTGLLVQQKA